MDTDDARAAGPRERAWRIATTVSPALGLGLALTSIGASEVREGAAQRASELLLLAANGLAGLSLALAARGRAARGASPTRVCMYALAAGAMLLVTSRAWVGDDAAITMRTLDNLVHGHGLRWNVAERVQVFTHPLWALLLAVPMAMGLSWYGSLVSLSLLSSAAFFAVLLRQARSPDAALAAIAVLACSRAFLDYCSSGLENPLSNLLLLWFVFALPVGRASARDVGTVALCAGLLCMNRPDTILLTAPGLMFTAGRAWRAQVRLAPLALRVLAGFAPLAAWLAFAVIYYGFPFPNTAYAKLGAGLSRGSLLELGVSYAAFTLRYDPWTLLAVAITGLALVHWRTSNAPLAVLSGALLYGLYLLGSGGDFMGGRHWVGPLVLAAALLGSQHLQPPERIAPAVPSALLLLGSLALWVPMRASPPYDGDVVDERAHYAPRTGLPAVVHASGVTHSWLRRGRTWREQAETLGARQAARGRLVRDAYTVGMLGLGAGPLVHIVDHLALTDPLLARLPAGYDPHPRSGHFARMGRWSSAVPEGARCPRKYEVCRFWRDYHDSLQRGTCRLDDALLCTYWQKLRLVTEGPLFTRERWRAIYELNTGALDHLIDRARYRNATRDYPDVE